MKRYANPQCNRRYKDENETLAVIDGKFGFGQTVGEQAVDIGIKKALDNGIAITALQMLVIWGELGIGLKEWQKKD